MAKNKYFLLVKEVSIRYEQVVKASSDDDAEKMFNEKLLKEVGVAKNYLDPIPCDEDGNPLEEGEDGGDDDEDDDEDEDEDGDDSGDGDDDGDGRHGHGDNDEDE